MSMVVGSLTVNRFLLMLATYLPSGDQATRNLLCGYSCPISSFCSDCTWVGAEGEEEYCGVLVVLLVIVLLEAAAARVACPWEERRFLIRVDDKKSLRRPAAASFFPLLAPVLVLVLVVLLLKLLLVPASRPITMDDDAEYCL